MTPFLTLISSSTAADRRTIVVSIASEYAGLIADGRLDELYLKMRSNTLLTDAEKRSIRQAANSTILPELRLEWGNHGLRQTFRFWSSSEKGTYLQRSMDILASVRQLTPDVCCGFGTVLGFVRDRDLIPHDDDIDLIAAFRREDVFSFSEAKRMLKAHLESSGFTVHGDNLSHFGVTFGAYAACDVFIGFIEGKRVSWFPSRRGGLLYSSVFPTKTIEVHGVECPVPADPEAYLVATYGPGWRSPDPQFNHPWDAAGYRDLR